jgi:predicted lipoprotein with Yx(FWY)xxD motif
LQNGFLKIIVKVKKGGDYMNKTWTIIIVIVVIAVVAFGGYKVWHHMQAQQAMQQAAMHPAVVSNSAMKPKPSTMMAENSVYKAVSDPKLGTIMKDPKGMTLYLYAKDSSGVSNCTGACLKAWPAYVAPANATNLPANITVIKRSDGTSQYAWKGLPLYYFIKDKDSGDAYGNGVGGVWAVVKL